jgi:hypothetical protein
MFGNSERAYLSNAKAKNASGKTQVEEQSELELFGIIIICSRRWIA